MAEFEVVKTPFGILKILTSISAALLSSVIAKMCGGDFQHDRFNLMVTVGLLIFCWCVVTLIAYGCGIDHKCQPATLRTLEITGASFFIVLSMLCMYYAMNSASYFGHAYDVLASKSAEEIANQRLIVPKEGATIIATKEAYLATYALDRNLNICAAVFSTINLVLLAVSAVLAKKKESVNVVGGPQPVQSAWPV